MERHQKILEKAKDNILKAQLQQKKIYDRKHNVPEVFKIGNVVLKKDFTRKKRKGGKLDAKWLGPYCIIGALGRGLYRLQSVLHDANIIPRVNGCHLKLYNVKYNKANYTL